MFVWPSFCDVFLMRFYTRNDCRWYKSHVLWRLCCHGHGCLTALFSTMKAAVSFSIHPPTQPSSGKTWPCWQYQNKPFYRRRCTPLLPAPPPSSPTYIIHFVWEGKEGFSVALPRWKCPSRTQSAHSSVCAAFSSFIAVASLCSPLRGVLQAVFSLLLEPGVLKALPLPLIIDGMLVGLRSGPLVLSTSPPQQRVRHYLRRCARVWAEFLYLDIHSGRTGNCFQYDRRRHQRTVFHLIWQQTVIFWHELKTFDWFDEHAKL